MMENKHIPAMSPTILHDYLREIGKQWTGQGTAIELGSWLGATAVPLLEGLISVDYDKTFYCFDMWKANGEQVIKAKAQGLLIKEKQDLLPLFMKNVVPVYFNTFPVQGRLPRTLSRYSGDPIEICIFDAPKSEPVFTGCIKSLIKYWIPGITILGLLDYNFYRSKKGNKHQWNKYLAPVRFMDQFHNHFEVTQKWTGSSEVFFKYIKKLEF